MAMPGLKDDYDLLRAYVDRHDDAAFAELVDRHADMVYAAAVRQVGRTGMADDVVQAVFILLEQKAPRIDRGIVMAAWLHKATRFAALNAMKNERRRHRHERLASERASAERLHLQSPAAVRAEAEWADGVRLLDEGVNTLGSADRAAIVLRFLERRPFAEVGKRLGVSEEAAQMRVGRALEKLRAFFRRKGVAMTVASLAAAIDVSSTAQTPAALKSLLLATPIRAARAISPPSPAVALAQHTSRAMSAASIRTVGVYLAFSFAVAALVAVLLIQWSSFRQIRPSQMFRGTERAVLEPTAEEGNSAWPRFWLQFALDYRRNS